MRLNPVFERFVEKSPISVMARGPRKVVYVRMCYCAGWPCSRFVSLQSKQGWPGQDPCRDGPSSHRRIYQ